MHRCAARMHDAFEHQLNLASGSITPRRRSSKAFGRHGADEARVRAGPSSTWPFRPMPRRRSDERVQRVAPGDRAPGCRPRCIGAPHRSAPAPRPAASSIGERDRHAHERTCPADAHANSRASRHTAASSSPGDGSRSRPPIACCRAATRVASASRNPPRRSHTVAGRLEVDALRDRSGRAARRPSRATSPTRSLPRPPGSVACASAAGNTLKVSSARMPSVPQLPTSAWWSRNPAAFFTTLPPLRVSRPRPSTMRAPMRKSRDPAVAIAARSVHARRHGAAERGPRRRASGGSNGRYCPCCASRRSMSRDRACPRAP